MVELVVRRCVVTQTLVRLREVPDETFQARIQFRSLTPRRASSASSESKLVSPILGLLDEDWSSTAEGETSAILSWVAAAEVLRCRVSEA